jgi:hypothetical protein
LFNYFNKYTKTEIKSRRIFVFILCDSAGNNYVVKKIINVDLELYNNDFVNKNRDKPVGVDDLEFKEYLMKVTHLSGGWSKPIRLLKIYWLFNKKRIFPWLFKS